MHGWKPDAQHGVSHFNHPGERASIVINVLSAMNRIMYIQTNKQQSHTQTLCVDLGIRGQGKEVLHSPPFKNFEFSPCQIILKAGIH